MMHVMVVDNLSITLHSNHCNLAIGLSFKTQPQTAQRTAILGLKCLVFYFYFVTFFCRFQVVWPSHNV